jgi:hypothetical protein
MEVSLQGSQDFKRMMGLELAGPHSQRTALSVLDFYPQTSRIVLSHLHITLGSTAEQSSDGHLIELLHKHRNEVSENSFVGLCLQAPLSLPPFFKKDSEKKIEEKWLSDLWNKTKPKPRSFLPYLNRPLDVWLRYFTPEKFQVPEALGANLAPLTARVQALKEKLPAPLFECHPRASMTRITHAASFNKHWAKLYTDTEKGLRTRNDFLTRFFQSYPQIFIYEGDKENLIVDLPAFQSFISAFSLFLNYRNMCDPKPESFPASASWTLLPRQEIRWQELF